MKSQNIVIFIAIIITITLLFSSCNSNNNKSDAYGNFEATEYLLSAETSGKIVALNIQEGSIVAVGQILAVIDTVQFSLKKEQIYASMGAINAKTLDVEVQITVLDKRRDNILREKTRIERLLKDSAATSKQYDDIKGELEVVDKQIAANRSQLNTSNSGLLSERKPLAVQVAQLNDQIERSYIKSPISGIVLTKYVNLGEFAAPGRLFFKVADLTKMNLRAYISGKQLSSIALGQKVKVLIDSTDGSMPSAEGTIVWISDKAEFSPKIIQTKEERVNLVYAMKIEVDNPMGKIKIGMPAEVIFK